MARLTFKAFKDKADKWYVSAVEVRDASHPLAVAAMGLMTQDFNTEALSYLLGRINAVRAFDTDAFVQWVFYCTGGHVGFDTDKGMPVIDPAKSFIRLDTKDGVRFKLKKVKTPRVDGMSEDDYALAKASAQAEREEAIKAAPQKAKGIKWWELSPEKPANPYAIKSLYSAIKKAGNNTDLLTAEERNVVEAILNTCAVQGVGEYVGIE